MDKIWIKYFIENGKGEQKQSILNANKLLKHQNKKKLNKK